MFNPTVNFVDMPSNGMRIVLPRSNDAAAGAVPLNSPIIPASRRPAWHLATKPLELRAALTRSGGLERGAA